jgi:hypothetical protein
MDSGGIIMIKKLAYAIMITLFLITSYLYFFTDNKNMTITFVVITGFLGGIIYDVYESKKKPKEK